MLTFGQSSPSPGALGGVSEPYGVFLEPPRGLCIRRVSFPGPARDAEAPSPGQTRGFVHLTNRGQGLYLKYLTRIITRMALPRLNNRSVSERHTRSRANSNRTRTYVKFFNTIQTNWIRRRAAAIRIAPPTQQQE